MEWTRLGQIFVASGEAPWMKTRAYVPTPWRRNENEIRIYLAFLDDQNRGRIGYLDLDASDPKKILRRSLKPCLDLGLPGCFDESGVTPLCIVERGPELWLYYVGWQKQREVPYSLLTGLAISRDQGETFVRQTTAPIFSSSAAEKFIRTAPFVIETSEGFTTWYHGCSGWHRVGDKQWPKTDLRIMHSLDGIHWPQEGKVILQARSLQVTGYGRPWLIREKNNWSLFVAERSIANAYRLVTATSIDGHEWSQPQAIAEFENFKEAWDDQNQSAPALMDIEDRRYLFYNGNQFGVGGFGAAVQKIMRPHGYR